MPIFAVQNKPESKTSGIRLNTALPFSVEQAKAPNELPGFQRKSACFCGGGCPRCQTNSPLQAKLKIGAPDDKYEQEADRVAEQVMLMPNPSVYRKPGWSFAKSSSYGNGETIVQGKSIAAHITSFVQRQPISQEDMDGALIQAKTARNVKFDVLPRVSSGIGSVENGGQKLSASERNFYEPRFGVDFSQVRLHRDSQSADLANSINARAFTVGRNIVFGSGQYDPHTSTGQQLVAHELVHVIQQNQTTGQLVQRAETDTRGQCTHLSDGASALNTFVNQQIRDAITATLMPTGRSTLPRPPNAINRVEETYRRLGAPLPIYHHLTVVGDWAKDNLPHRGGGYFPSGHRYEGASGGYLNYLAPAVNICGHCVGIDKIDHMFQQGYWYFLIWRNTVAQFSSTLGHANASSAGESYARGWGEWSEGQLSSTTRGNPAVMGWLASGMSTISGLPSQITGMQRGGFGLSATGIHSRGDLAANAAGLRFYRDLLANPSLTFDIARYITADWDEEVSGNIFRHDIGQAVRSHGRLNPNDVVLPAP